MNRKQQIHLLIAVAIFIVLKLLLPADTEMGLTKVGASVLALFISTLYVWLTVGTDWTSFLAIGLLAFTGIAPMGKLWEASWGNSIVVLVILITTLSYAINKMGVAKQIATWFITRKIAEKKPYVFLLLFMTANLLVAYVMDAIPTTIVFMMIAKEVLDDLQYTKKDKTSKVLYLIVLWITSIGMSATPISHSLVLFVIGMVEGALGPVSFAKYMMVGIPYSILMFAIIFLIIKYIIKPDMSKFLNYDIEKKRKEMQPLSKKGKVAAGIYALVIFLWLFPDLAANIAPTAAGYVKLLGNTLPPLIGVSLLCIIRVDGEPCISFPEAIKTAPWGAIVFIASTMVFMFTFNLEAGGINVFMKNLVSPIAANLSPQMIVVIALLLTLVLTQFLSNLLAATIIFSAFIPVLLGTVTSPLSLLSFAIMMSIFTNNAFMTPPANACVPIVLKDEYVTTGDVFKYSSIVVLSIFAIGMLLILPLAKLVF